MTSSKRGLRQIIALGGHDMAAEDDVKLTRFILDRLPQNALASVFCPREAVKIISTLHASIATFWRLTFNRRTCRSSNPTLPTLPIFCCSRMSSTSGEATQSQCSPYGESGVWTGF